MRYPTCRTVWTPSHFACICSCPASLGARLLPRPQHHCFDHGPSAIGRPESLVEMASGAGPAALAYNTSLASLNAVPTANDLGRPLNRYIDMRTDMGGMEPPPRPGAGIGDRPGKTDGIGSEGSMPSRTWMPAYELRRGGFKGFVGGHGAGSHGLVPPPPGPHRAAPEVDAARRKIAEHKSSTVALKKQLVDERVRMHNYMHDEIEGGRAYGASDEVAAHGANFQVL